MKIPFTTEQFMDVFRAYNQTVYPAQVVLFIIALLIASLAIVPKGQSDRIISYGLAFLWIWMGLVYHLLFFSRINPAAYAINLGRRPTFYEHADISLLEAHLLDFEGDLYGEPARIQFVAFLRSERKFDGIDALVEQLKHDIEHAREAVAD
jgi:hypothetical protein